MRIQSKYLEEKLTAADPTSKWISDFVRSDNPKFAGKSKKERIRMALGASYAAKGQSRNEETTPPFTPDKNKTPIAKPGKAGYGPSAAKHLAKMAMKKQKNEEVEQIDEVSADALLAVAKKVSPNAKISTPETRKKDKEDYEKRTAKYAGKPNTSSAYLNRPQSYPLGGYDPKSNRSYSEEVEIEEGIGGAIAGGIGQFIGNKIDPLHGEILRTHGEMAGRAAEYTIRKHLNRLHKALKSHLSSGNATNESAEYDSLPASKALQTAHDEERKKRGLPDPDYYLKLAAQKKKEIEDMKKNEDVQITEALSHSEMAAHHIEAGKEHERIANRIGDASPIDSDAHHEAKYLHYQAAELHTKAANTNDPQHKEEARNATKEALHMSKSENQYERNPTIDHHNSKLTEHVEQIDELKKSTLASYAKKASHDARIKMATGKDFERIGRTSKKPAYKASAQEWENKYKSDARRREAGVNRAIDKLAKEEVERVDELKKSTLGSYIKKSQTDKSFYAADIGRMASAGDTASSSYDNIRRKHKNRGAGINRAVDRLAKEEVELDEISQNTALNAYAQRAARASTTKDPKDQEKADKSITRIGKRWTADAQRRAWNRADKLIYKEETELDEGKKKGLWDNIHAKRKRGERPARPGEKGYPKTLNIEGTELDEAGRMQGGGKDPCWKGYKMIGTKNKAGREVPNCVPVKEEKTFKSLREKLNGNE